MVTGVVVAHVVVRDYGITDADVDTGSIFGMDICYSIETVRRCSHSALAGRRSAIFEREKGLLRDSRYRVTKIRRLANSYCVAKSDDDFN